MTSQPTDTNDAPVSKDFIREIINEHNEIGKFNSRVHTRFPPEPNGYLHIGHAKSICLNFGIAQDYEGMCNLRFDDTNPEKEEVEYVDSIQEDVRWLGFDWDDRKFFASDYFDALYDCAVDLIKRGKAYVCELNAQEMREYRGTLTEPGKNSPYRDRTVEENLALFEQMKNGEVEDGKFVLRAKIDMASPNINMRDPVIYRVRKAEHHRTGNKWCIYPMYDFTHCISDSIERITHSICTLEFEDHRPLYDWILESLELYRPQQIEFARLNLSYMLMSKRKLLELVQKEIVSGWDDPRMPTLSGLRRRGYTAEAIREFCRRIGVAKTNSLIDIALFDHCLREDLNLRAPRVMAVLDPIKVTIENYPEGQVEEMEAVNNPEDESQGTRSVPFSREVYIERTDFMEEPFKKYFRLAPGKEVRLKHAYYITCKDVIKDADGNITELICTYDPESRGGGTPDNRRVKGTLQWVSVPHAVDATVRIFETLFTEPVPGEKTGNYLDDLNPESMKVLTNCKVEPSLAKAKPEDRFQFMRHGYFCPDSKDFSPERPVFNRTVGLRDSWAKMVKKQ